MRHLSGGPLAVKGTRPRHRTRPAKARKSLSLAAGIGLGSGRRFRSPAPARRRVASSTAAMVAAWPERRAALDAWQGYGDGGALVAASGSRCGAPRPRRRRPASVDGGFGGRAGGVRAARAVLVRAADRPGQGALAAAVRGQGGSPAMVGGPVARPIPRYPLPAGPGSAARRQPVRPAAVPPRFLPS